MRSVFVSALLLVAAPAFADDVDTGEQRTADVKDAVDSGNFLPFSVSPSTSSTFESQVLGELIVLDEKYRRQHQGSNRVPEAIGRRAVGRTRPS